MKLNILKPSLWGAGLLALSIALFPNLSAAKSNIVIGLQQEPTSLDPTSDATASIDGMLSHNVYESLTTVSEAGEVLPALADSWTISDDKLTYRFNLASGVEYHDGTSFDSGDVIYAFNRAMSEDSVNPTKKIFKVIESVTAIDAHTVELSLIHI